MRHASVRAPRVASGIRGLLCVAGILGVGCGSTALLKDLPPPDVEVQFSDTALDPAVARVQAGGNVVWLNEDSTYAAAVFLPAAMKDGFTCSDLRPGFSEVAGGYLSQPIAGDTERVELPCPLKPGSYAYELILYEPNLGGPDNPARKLPGSIVVDSGGGSP